MQVLDHYLVEKVEKNLPRLSDEALMMLFKNSCNSEYFELLVSRYRHKLFNFAFNLLHNDCEAEEIVQETFIRVWRNCQNFRGDAAFSSWIFTIVQNLCKDIWRRRRRKQSYGMMPFNPLSVHEHEDAAKGYRRSINQLTDNLPETGQEAENSELKVFITSCLQQLPTDQRDAVMLRDIEGHSYKKIANLTGVAIGTVRSRLHYGRQKLKEIIK